MNVYIASVSVKNTLQLIELEVFMYKFNVIDWVKEFVKTNTYLNIQPGDLTTEEYIDRVNMNPMIMFTIHLYERVLHII